MAQAVGSRSRIWSGLILIALGVLFLLDRFGYLNFGDFLSVWWPTILILIGIVQLVGGRRWGGLLLICLGVLFQGDRLHVFVWWRARDLWPLLLVAAGLRLLIGRVRSCPAAVSGAAEEAADQSSEGLSRIVEIWKKTIDVQQHFNDLELRIRNYAITILAAVLGLAAYAIKESLEISLFGYRSSVAAVTFFAAIVPWAAFYFMDRLWYHRLLYGAVDHGSFIEHRWRGLLPELSLTDAIGKYSPFTFLGHKIHSPRKIDLFYLVGVAFLILMGIVSHLAARRTLGFPADSYTLW